MSPAKTGSKQGGRFQPGESGNPRGRPRGSRNAATIALEALLGGEGEAITRTAIRLAKEGHPMAMKLCLERIFPAPKDRVVTFPLRPINCSRDAADAMSDVMKAVSSGRLTPSDAEQLSKVVACMVKSFEAAEFADSLVPLAQLSDAELMRIAAGDDPTVVVSSRSRKLLTLNPR
jgi:hypothetical protein